MSLAVPHVNVPVPEHHEALLSGLTVPELGPEDPGYRFAAVTIHDLSADVGSHPQELMAIQQAEVILNGARAVLLATHGRYIQTDSSHRTTRNAGGRTCQLQFHYETNQTDQAAALQLGGWLAALEVQMAGEEKRIHEVDFGHRTGGWPVPVRAMGLLLKKRRMYGIPEAAVAPVAESSPAMP